MLVNFQVPPHRCKHERTINHWVHVKPRTAGKFQDWLETASLNLNKLIWSTKSVIINFISPDSMFLSCSRYGYWLAFGSWMVWDMPFGLWSMFQLWKLDIWSRWFSSSCIFPLSLMHKSYVYLSISLCRPDCILAYYRLLFQSHCFINWENSLHYLI